MVGAAFHSGADTSTDGGFYTTGTDRDTADEIQWCQTFQGLKLADRAALNTAVTTGNAKITVKPDAEVISAKGWWTMLGEVNASANEAQDAAVGGLTFSASGTNPTTNLIGGTASDFDDLTVAENKRVVAAYNALLKVVPPPCPSLPRRCRWSDSASSVCFWRGAAPISVAVGRNTVPTRAG